MNRTLSLPVQELIRASERVLVFATSHKGVPKDDFEAVLSCAYELIQDIKSTRPSSQSASQEVQVCLLFCLRCRLVLDEQETVDEPWITTQKSKRDTRTK